MDRVRFSGIVVTFNDARRLGECLRSLRFCDEIIVVDLGSSDESVRIAESSGARVERYQRLPVVEMVRARVCDMPRNDWLVFLDPDEVFPVEAVSLLAELVCSRKDVATVMVPWQFYFRGKQLDCTVWGGRKRKEAVVHRRRVSFLETVHHGFSVRSGYVTLPLETPEGSVIRHYWMDSFPQLFEKHSRYVTQEGSSRHARGERFTWPGAAREVARSLKLNLIDCRGWRCGLLGWYLSVFYAWYVFRSLMSLRRFQRGAGTAPRVSDDNAA